MTDDRATAATVPGADADERFLAVADEIMARRPEHAVQPTLQRVATLVDLLGDPHRACPVIHVTGTNGKTSTARMIDELLRQRGLRTGRFTSPHLTSMRERICVDGQSLSAEAFVARYEEVLPYLRLTDEQHQVPLSFFEVLTGMAFAAFADAPVDVVVLEVGIGGSWDATNVADGSVAVVCPIAVDHTNYLGDSVTSIAEEKAGIIKPGAVAVLARQPADAAWVLQRRVAEVGAMALREGVDFDASNRELAVGGQQVTLRGPHGSYPEVFLPLFGVHQAGNAACAVAAVEAFASVGTDAAGAAGQPVVGAGCVGTAHLDDGRGGNAQLDLSLVRAAFAEVASPGRLELVGRDPAVLVDAAHNPAGMAASVDAAREAFRFRRLVGVVAVSADKDVPGLLAELEPALSEVVVTSNCSPRSMAGAELAELAGPIFGAHRVHAVAHLDEAIDTAVALAAGQAGPDASGPAGVLVTGSVVTAGEARALLGAADVAAPHAPPDARRPTPSRAAAGRHVFTAADLS